MLLPICRWRAAVVGVMFALAGPSAVSLFAGIVAPPESDPLAVAPPSSFSPPADRAGDAAVALPLPSPSGDDAQPFWFPGADGVDTVNISSIPVRSSADGAHATSAFPGMQEHPLIPLPGAAWTGMAGLLGLGAVKVLRNFRRLLA